MSLLSLGYKMQSLKKGMEEGSFTTKEQVKAAAQKMRVADSAGYGNLSKEESELWYDQLAENVFTNHNNWIPCFVDLGFGRELLDHSSGMWNHREPKKQHWKIVITRGKFPEWQFNAIVTTFTREEAVCIMKKYFGDFGDLDFHYDEPTPKTEHKVPWVEINSKKIGNYREYVEINK